MRELSAELAYYKVLMLLSPPLLCPEQLVWRLHFFAPLSCRPLVLYLHSLRGRRRERKQSKSAACERLALYRCLIFAE